MPFALYDRLTYVTAWKTYTKMMNKQDVYALERSSFDPHDAAGEWLHPCIMQVRLLDECGRTSMPPSIVEAVVPPNTTQSATAKLADTITAVPAMAVMFDVLVHRERGQRSGRSSDNLSGHLSGSSAPQ
jgi:hypothetical protein